MTDDARRQRARIMVQSAIHEHPRLHGQFNCNWVVDFMLAFADAEAKRVCKWSLADEDASMWETTCGHAFVFNDGGPKENHARFCPYCGGTLESTDGSKASAPRKDAGTEPAGSDYEAPFDSSHTAHRCPVCNGNGSVPFGFYSGYGPGDTSSGIQPIETCRACTGKGILWR